MQKKNYSNELFITDRFCTLSKDAQLLFFHIVFRISDNGVINNANSICRILNISSDCIEELIKNNYLTPINDDLGLRFEITDYDKLLGKNSRNTYQNHIWKQKVKERDGNKCAFCGSTKNLQVHHVLSYSKYPKLRYAVENGITLCFDCHLKEHKGDWHNV